MKYVILIIAVCVLFAATGCPKGGKLGTAESPSGINSHSGAVITPPANGGTTPPDAGGQTPPETAGTGETDLPLQLGDMQLGMEYVAVRAKFPAGWTESPQWAKGAEEQTGIINFTGTAPAPEKGVVTPPEVLTYAFLDGKLVAMLRAVPKIPQSDIDTYINEMGKKYGGTSGQTPPFADACDFLMPLRKPAPGDKVAVWYNNAKQQLLGVEYSSMVGLATYYLTEAPSYTKVTQIMMGTAPASTPAADPATGK
jgi:hypothetical protein